MNTLVCFGLSSYFYWSVTCVVASDSALIPPAPVSKPRIFNVEQVKIITDDTIGLFIYPGNHFMYDSAIASI